MTDTQIAGQSPSLREFLQSADPEATFVSQMRSLVGERRAREPRRSPRGDDPLRFLLVGYSGGGNTGADVRVAEMIRQLNAIFSDGRVSIDLTIIGHRSAPDVFRGAQQVLMEDYAVDFLDRAADRYDGMFSCEGSMFKSKKSNMFAALMGATLGVAAAQGALAVGYGADVGPMDATLRCFISDLGRGPLVLGRSQESTRLLLRHGLRAEMGADTAWTYDCASPSESRALLRTLGWSETEPILVVCPVNPFWWPVRVDVAKAVEMQKTGAHSDTHYGGVFFHSDSKDRRRNYGCYLDALAHAARHWRSQTGGYVLIVGMDWIDRVSCVDLAARLPFAAGQILSGQKPIREIVGALRLADVMISSRYHAIVTSMPAMPVAIGVSLDERIANLLQDAGAGDRLLQVDDPDLADRLVATMRATRDDRGSVAQAAGREVARQIRAMAQMGKALAEEAQRIYPEIGTPPPDSGWERYIPQLSPELEDLLEKYS